MPPTRSVDPVTPALSIRLVTWAESDPGHWQPMLDLARAADQAGVDRLFVSEHVVLGENLEAYGRPELGGVSGGKQPTGPDGLWLDPLTLLAVVAGITSRIRLATGVLLAALRRPVVLAKASATLDVLSGGRLDLGVGVGWQREEYQAAGLDFAGRGRLLDHTLAVCQTLWRDERASFDADGLRFEAIHCMPKPLQPGGVPLWISGRLNRRVLDRIVRFGRGWIPWALSTRDLGPAIAEVKEALATAGRDTLGFQVTNTLLVDTDADRTPLLGPTMERVPALVAAGVTDFTVHLPLPEDPSAAADRLAEVVRAFREVVGRSES